MFDFNDIDEKAIQQDIDKMIKNLLEDITSELNSLKKWADTHYRADYSGQYYACRDDDDLIYAAKHQEIYKTSAPIFYKGRNWQLKLAANTTWAEESTARSLSRSRKKSILAIPNDKHSPRYWFFYQEVKF